MPPPKPGRWLCVSACLRFPAEGPWPRNPAGAGSRVCASTLAWLPVVCFFSPRIGGFKRGSGHEPRATALQWCSFWWHNWWGALTSAKVSGTFGFSQMASVLKTVELPELRLPADRLSHQGVSDEGCSQPSSFTFYRDCFLQRRRASSPLPPPQAACNEDASVWVGRDGGWQGMGVSRGERGQAAHGAPQRQLCPSPL